MVRPAQCEWSDPVNLDARAHLARQHLVLRPGHLEPSVVTHEIESEPLVGYPAAEHYLGYNGPTHDDLPACAGEPHSGGRFGARRHGQPAEPTRG